MPLWATLRMGNSSSSSAGRAAPSSNDDGEEGAGGAAAGPPRLASLQLPCSFSVRTVRMPFAPPEATLTVTTEALALYDPEQDGRLVRAFPFHKIACWGFTEGTFRWRAMLDEADPEFGGSGGASAQPAAAAEAAGAGAAASAFSSLPALPSTSASSASFTVLTSEGERVEAVLMESVLRLMSAMEARGVPDLQFAQLTRTLEALAEEGLADRCLAAVRQMALGRAFSTRQAVSLVHTIGAISPFEKLEAAVALHAGGALLNRDDAFVLILRECFDDQADRDNAAHRCGLRITESGGLERLRKGGGGAGGGGGGGGGAGGAKR